MRSSRSIVATLAGAAIAHAHLMALEEPPAPVKIPIKPLPPLPEESPAYEQLGYTKREIERNAAKEAKAEAKRQRRRERNLRFAGAAKRQSSQLSGLK